MNIGSVGGGISTGVGLQIHKEKFGEIADAAASNPPYRLLPMKFF